MQTLPFSQAIKANGFVFVSGQLALRDGMLVGNDVATQTDIALDRIAAALAEHGLELCDVVRCSVWLTVASDFAVFNTAYAARFGTRYPVRATVVSELLIPGALVEIDAIAALRQGMT